MNPLKYLLLWLLVPSAVYAQYIEVQENYTPQELVQDVLINNPCASASNVSVSGFNFGGGNSYAYFSAGSSTFPFSEGIILSTGSAVSAIGPNTSLVSEGPSSWPGDQDLEQALGVNNSVNATILEFDFVPLGNKISFDYIFSSEQYLTSPSPNQCNYTDGFVFLLKPLNSTQPYQNLAIIPNTNIPVKVNTVRGPGTICPSANEQYFDAFNEEEHPTNFNGQTVVMTAQADVVPNVAYHIKLVVADQGNNLYDSAIFLGGGSFRIEKDLGPDRLIATGNPACDGESILLDATETTATVYTWFQDGAVIPGAVTSTYNVTTPGTYSVEIGLGAGCASTGEIEIEYADAVQAATLTHYQCDPNGDGSAFFNLTHLNDLISTGNTQASVTYFNSMADAQAGVNPIGNPQSFSASALTTVVALVTNQFGCTGFSTITLGIANNTVPTPTPVGICDEDASADGIAWINFNDLVTPQVVSGLPAGLSVEYYLTQADAEAMQNVLPNIWNNTIPNQQVIYARFVNGTDCFGVVPVTLQISAFPADFLDEVLFICPGGNLTLSVPDIFSSYDWSTGDLDHDTEISAPGIYLLTVTDAIGCSRSKIFDVQLTQPPVIASVTINDFAGDDNAVTINFSGNGNYEFSIDGEHFQASPVFHNVAPGNYSAYINDLSGCSNAGPVSFLVLDYPRYFTPNGDGINDIWAIKGTLSLAGLQVRIFDRYGKLLYDFEVGGNGWDGKWHGAELPSTDYWFTLSLPDGRTFKSHFSLKR